MKKHLLNTATFSALVSTTFLASTLDGFCRQASTSQPRALRAHLLGRAHGRVDNLLFSPNNRLLCFVHQALHSSTDEVNYPILEVWDVGSGTMRLRLLASRSPSYVEDAIFSPDSRFLVGSHWTRKNNKDIQFIQVVSVRTGKVVRSFSYPKHHDWDWIGTLAFWPRPTILTGVSSDSIYQWSARTGRLLHTKKLIDGQMELVALSPNGSTIASSDRNDKSASGKQGLHNGLRLYDVRRGLTRVVDKGWRADALFFSPGGRYIISDSRVWSTRTGRVEPRHRYMHPSVLSPNRKTFVDFSDNDDDGQILLRSARTRKITHVLGGHRDSIHAYVFSPNSRMMATSDGTGAVRLWRIR